MLVHTWFEGRYSFYNNWKDPAIRTGTYAFHEDGNGITKYGLYGGYDDIIERCRWTSVYKESLPPEFVLLLTTLGVEI